MKKRKQLIYINIYQKNPNLKRLIAKTANIHKGFA